MPPGEPKSGGISWGKAFLISGISLAGFCVLLMFGTAVMGNVGRPAETVQEAMPAAKAPAPEQVTEPPVLAKLDVKSLFYKSPKEVEAILGKVVEVTPIKVDESTSGMTPGEFRDYDWQGASLPILTRFYRGQLVFIQIDTKRGYSSPTQALQDFGIDPSPVRPRISNEYTSRWTAKIDGVLFKDASAYRADDKNPYNIVRFEVADPD